MVEEFDIILEDFLSDLEAISAVVVLCQDQRNSRKTKIASVNSASLLLAATFEEFVREMARQYARLLVARVRDPGSLPRKFAATAWKRTLEEIARAKIDTGGTPVSLTSIAREARTSFEKVCAFIEGDLEQDIYKELIHNESNMRPTQINQLFNVSSLSNVCLIAAASDPVKAHYGEDSEGAAHGRFMVDLNDFMEKRNGIAHALNPGSSAGPEAFLQDVGFLKAFGQGLATVLPLALPQQNQTAAVA